MSNNLGSEFGDFQPEGGDDLFASRVLPDGEGLQEPKEQPQPRSFSPKMVGLIVAGVLVVIIIVATVGSQLGVKRTDEAPAEGPSQVIQETEAPSESPIEVQVAPSSVPQQSGVPLETGVPTSQPVAPAGGTSLEEAPEPTDQKEATSAVVVDDKKVYVYEGDTYSYQIVMLLPAGDESRKIPYFVSKKVYDQLAVGDLIQLTYAYGANNVISVVSVTK